MSIVCCFFLVCCLFSLSLSLSIYLYLYLPLYLSRSVFFLFFLSLSLSLPCSFISLCQSFVASFLFDVCSLSLSLYLSISLAWLVQGKLKVTTNFFFIVINIYKFDFFKILRTITYCSLLKAKGICIFPCNNVNSVEFM